MKARTLSLLALTIAVSLGAAPGRGANPSTRPADPNRALRAVLNVERQSQAFYRAVLDKHRPLPPFGMVYRMEIGHEQKLVDEMKRRAMTVPASSEEKTAVPDDTKECLAKAVEMEKATIAAYDRAIKRCRDSEVRQVLEKLRTESVDHQRWFADPSSCPMFGGGRGAGAGCGWRGGRGSV